MENKDLKTVHHAALLALYRASIALKTMHQKQGLEQYEAHYKERAETYEAEINRRMRLLEAYQEAKA